MTVFVLQNLSAPLMVSQRIHPIYSSVKNKGFLHACDVIGELHENFYCMTFKKAADPVCDVILHHLQINHKNSLNSQRDVILMSLAILLILLCCVQTSLKVNKRCK